MKPIIVAAIAPLLLASLPMHSVADSQRLIINIEFFLPDLDEKIMRGNCTDATDQIRLVVIRTFADAWAVRIDRTGNDVSIHRAKAAGLTPDTRSSTKFDISDWQALSDILSEVNFSNLTPGSQTNLWRPDDDIATFEWCHGGKYKLVQRQRLDSETVLLFEHLRSMKSGD